MGGQSGWDTGNVDQGPARRAFLDSDFADWYPSDGRPGLSPARLALVSVLQFAENLTDRQAAQAVACRIDWKYTLGLDLDAAGFDHTVLCEFRERMAHGDRADRLLAVMVDRLAAAGLVKARGRQRTDSTHVLAAIRTLSRLELVGETLRAALDEIAGAAPEWLVEIMNPEWEQRYGRPIRYDRLPRGTDAQRAWVLTVGADGVELLGALAHPGAPKRLRRGRQAEILRQVWVQQFWFDSTGQLQWRDAKQTKDRRTRRSAPRRSTSAATGSPDPTSAQVPWSGTEIVSPHDPEARFCHYPGKAQWIGYKVHQTETCDDDLPHVIVHVLTTTAPEQDVHALQPIHTALAAQELLPGEHLVDAGYITPQVIHHAATEHAVTMIGPVREDPRAKEHPGFTKEDFIIDWAARTATCPQGITSPPWKPTVADQRPGISVLYRRGDCRDCTVRLQCTGNVDDKGRHLLLLPEPLQKIQSHARVEQKTLAWQQKYAARAGCEATVSETVHAHGLRRCRYRGLARTHVQHVLTAAGTDLIRLSQHPNRLKPKPPRRFHQLCLTRPSSRTA
ncbi:MULTISPECIES: IS1182 family transposase [Nocardia]|nr:IS1182 family transposase [Nocardia africana]MCC3317831.1 IS1182 family transposase [Nocardia africana]